MFFFTSLVLRSCEVVLCNEFTMVGAELSYPHSCRRLPPAEGEHCWMKKKKKSITWWLFNRVMYTGEEICARMKGPPGVCCCCCCRASLGARPPRLMRADRRNLSICYLILFFFGRRLYRSTWGPRNSKLESTALSSSSSSWWSPSGVFAVFINYPQVFPIWVHLRGLYSFTYYTVYLLGFFCGIDLVMICHTFFFVLEIMRNGKRRTLTDMWL